MPKELIYNHDARSALVKGVDKVANAVKVTLGPKGRNVVIEDEYGGNPVVTKDGVTVAKNIVLKDPYENMGAMLCKQVSQKSNDIVGDGTTTATLLTQIIVNEGMKYIAAGGNPISLKKGIDKAVDYVAEQLLEMAQPVESKEHIAYVGTIAGNDAEVGTLVAEAMEAVGKDGVITIEENAGVDTILDLTEGMQFDRGFLSARFVNDPERMEARLENCHILLCDHKIEHIVTILPLLEKLSRQPLLIIAEDVVGDALAGIVLNRIQAAQPWCAIKAPGFGQRRKDILEDLAVLTGATVVSQETGVNFENITLDHLGMAKVIVVNKENTTILEGAGTVEAIENRIKELKSLLGATVSSFEREKLQERLSSLSGGIAVIKVGAATEAELKEKKFRYDDALGSVRAAVESGIVPGGGVALLLISQDVEGVEVANEDELMGVKIVKRALSEPIRQICNNAGIPADVVVDKVLASEPGFGLDARTGEYVDMIESGIIDPVKVTRSAIRHAASIAGLILTTESLIAEELLPPGMISGQQAIMSGMFA